MSRQSRRLRGQSRRVALVVLAGVPGGEIVVEHSRAAGEAEGGNDEALGSITVLDELRVGSIGGEELEAERDLIRRRRRRGRGKWGGVTSTDGHEDVNKDEDGEWEKDGSDSPHRSR
jgi:hypothetical protein